LETPGDMYRLCKIRDLKSFPDKCDTCAFKVEYSRDFSSIDADFQQLAELSRVGLSDRPFRLVNVGGSEPDSYCALGMNRCWGGKKKYRKCPCRQRRLPDVNLSDALSIHHSRVNTRLALRLGILGICLTLAAIAATIWGPTLGQLF